MSNHTPGPWEVRDRWYIHVAEPGTFSHAEVKCCPHVPSENTEEHEANARLMAAAPELLEVCKSLRSWAIPGMNWTDEIGRELLAIADAAIAKAEGTNDDTPGASVVKACDGAGRLSWPCGP